MNCEQGWQNAEGHEEEVTRDDLSNSDLGLPLRHSRPDSTRTFVCIHCWALCIAHSCSS